MAVFIEARTDAFEQSRTETAANIRAYGRDSYPVRRPFRGIQIKKDTYAVLRIMGSDGQFIPVIDAAGELYEQGEGTATTTYYSNFIVTNVSEQRQEKQQIVDTFGDSYIFFFGESPRLLQVQGVLLNTADFNWRAEFWHNYEHYFRGTRLVEMGARLYLIYDEQIVEGFMTSAQAQEDNQNRHVLPFSFQMYLTGYTNFSDLGKSDFPAPPDMDYTQLSSYERSLQLWEQSRNLQRETYGQTINALNRRAYVMGTGRKLADVIRGNIINAGDPSFTGFVQRAYLAANMYQASRPAGPATGFAANPFQPPSRTIPLRSKFQDNRDEYVGDALGSEAEATNQLSLADRWRENDQLVDRGLENFLGGEFDKNAVMDVMGRLGRAETEIRSSGGFRNNAVGIRRGLLVGAGVSRSSPLYMRDRPFGMVAVDAEY